MEEEIINTETQEGWATLTCRDCGATQVYMGDKGAYLCANCGHGKFHDSHEHLFEEVPQDFQPE